MFDAVSDLGPFELLIRTAFLAVALVIATYDTMTLRIPNFMNAIFAVLFFPAALVVWHVAGSVNWLSHLGGGLAMLALAILAFRFNVFGGGDAKLLAACGLWVGVWALPFFLMATAFLGGIEAVGFWVARKLIISVVVRTGADGAAVRLPVVLLDGAAIPYGVAIVIGLMITAWWSPQLWAGELHTIFFTLFHQ
jgi:prepilin peptidase CpaA